MNGTNHVSKLPICSQCTLSLTRENMASILALPEDLIFGKIFCQDIKNSDLLNLFKPNTKKYGI